MSRVKLFETIRREHQAHVAREVDVAVSLMRGASVDLAHAVHNPCSIDRPFELARHSAIAILKGIGFRL